MWENNDRAVCIESEEIEKEKKILNLKIIKILQKQHNLRIKIPVRKKMKLIQRTLKKILKNF